LICWFYRLALFQSFPQVSGNNITPEKIITSFGLRVKKRVVFAASVRFGMAVEVHRANIKAKLKLKSASELIRFAVR
jgi:hypothetical protein